MKLTLIPIEKLLELKENNEEYILVDVMPAENFAEGHIPGAINIPYEEIGSKADELLDKEKTIITYCKDYMCTGSSVAAKKLMHLGYEKVLDFAAGTRGWEQAGLPLEK